MAKRPPRGKSSFAVVESDTSVDPQVRKAVEAIAIQPRAGRITLLTRKLFNSLLFHAQRQGTGTESFRIPLADLVRNADFDSNDTELIKEHLRRMLEVRVEWNDPGRSWEASTLVSHARISKEQGSVWFEWSYPPNIKTRLLDPEVYTRLSLQFQTVLRSSASLALYEVCLRYKTNPSRLTLRMGWSWWVPVLTGNPDRDENLEYKYFKRDTLKPAVQEVNALTDITVELIEHKQGRRVAELQFRVEEKQQKSLALEEAPIFDTSLLKRMMALGLSQRDAQTMYASNEESKVRATLDWVEQRQRSKSLASISSAAAYFKDALRKGYARESARVAGSDAGTASQNSAAQGAVDQMRRLREAYDNAQREQAKHLFEVQTETARLQAVEAFESEQPAVLPKPLQRLYRQQGLANAMVAATFFDWLARKTWAEEPTDKELLDFALKRGLLKTG